MDPGHLINRPDQHCFEEYCETDHGGLQAHKADQIKPS
jgi:hypothetical protein